METMIKPARHLGAAMLLALCVSCGGGGGGGDETSGGAGSEATSQASAPPPAQVMENLAVSIKWPTSYSYINYSGMGPGGVLVDVKHTGDLSVLAGKTIYAFVVAPPGVVYDQADIMMNYDSETVRAHFYGGPQPAVGKYEGDLKIYVCIDPECRTQLKNSPLSLPFSLTVRPGLELSTYEINVESDGLTIPPPVEVVLRLPNEAIGWSYSNSLPEYGSYYRQDGNKLIFQPHRENVPKSFTETVSVTATVPHSDYGPGGYPLRRFIKVNYTVKPRP